MKIIGITGKSGSGKSTLTELLSKKLNCKSVNIDKIGHRATSDEKIVEKLCQTFGNDILDNEGKVDRKKLGNIVFSSKEKMDLLTEITWGYMQNIIDDILKEKPEFIILEWALLPIDDKYWSRCDVKILMTADYDERKKVVIERDNITEEYFAKRELSCIDYTKFKFDYLFENDYKVDTINSMVDLIKIE